MAGELFTTKELNQEMKKIPGKKMWFDRFIGGTITGVAMGVSTQTLVPRLLNWFKPRRETDIQKKVTDQEVYQAIDFIRGKYQAEIWGAGLYDTDQERIGRALQRALRSHNFNNGEHHSSRFKDDQRNKYNKEVVEKAIIQSTTAEPAEALKILLKTRGRTKDAFETGPNAALYSDQQIKMLTVLMNDLSLEIENTIGQNLDRRKALGEDWKKPLFLEGTIKQPAKEALTGEPLIDAATGKPIMVEYAGLLELMGMFANAHITTYTNKGVSGAFAYDVMSNQAYSLQQGMLNDFGIYRGFDSANPNTSLYDTINTGILNPPNNRYGAQDFNRQNTASIRALMAGVDPRFSVDGRMSPHAQRLRDAHPFNPAQIETLVEQMYHGDYAENPDGSMSIFKTDFEVMMKRMKLHDGCEESDPNYKKTKIALNQVHRDPETGEITGIKSTSDYYDPGETIVGVSPRDYAVLAQRNHEICTQYIRDEEREMIANGVPPAERAKRIKELENRRDSICNKTARIKNPEDERKYYFEKPGGVRHSSAGAPEVKMDPWGRSTVNQGFIKAKGKDGTPNGLYVKAQAEGVYQYLGAIGKNDVNINTIELLVNDLDWAIAKEMGNAPLANGQTWGEFVATTENKERTNVMLNSVMKYLNSDDFNPRESTSVGAFMDTAVKSMDRLSEESYAHYTTNKAKRMPEIHNVVRKISRKVKE